MQIKGIVRVRPSVVLRRVIGLHHFSTCSIDKFLFPCAPLSDLILKKPFRCLVWTESWCSNDVDVISRLIPESAAESDNPKQKVVSVSLLKKGVLRETSDYARYASVVHASVVHAPKVNHKVLGWWTDRVIRTVGVMCVASGAPLCVLDGRVLKRAKNSNSYETKIALSLVCVTKKSIRSSNEVVCRLLQLHLEHSKEKVQ